MNIDNRHAKYLSIRIKNNKHILGNNGSYLAFSFDELQDMQQIINKHIKNIQDKKDSLETCPKCKQKTLQAKGIYKGGGVECTNCGYWFCY